MAGVHLEMQVRPRGVPGGALVADLLAGRHLLPDGHRDGRHVAVVGEEAVAVVDEYGIAVPLRRSRRHDDADAGGADRRAVRGREIDARVQTAPALAEA